MSVSFTQVSELLKSVANNDDGVEFATDPAQYFCRHGVQVPDSLVVEFNGIFSSLGGGQAEPPGATMLIAFPDLVGPCIACVATALLCVPAIIAAGAEAITGLAETSAIVITLSNVLEISTEAALEALQGVAGMLDQSPVTIARSLCVEAGIC